MKGFFIVNNYNILISNYLLYLLLTKKKYKQALKLYTKLINENEFSAELY